MAQKLMAAAAFACGIFLVVASAPAEAPQKDKLAHPYLFYRADELEAIRKRFVKPPQSHYLTALVRRAEARDRTGEHLWAYLLTGDQKFRRLPLQWAEKESSRTDFSDEWIGFKVIQMSVIYDTLYRELEADARAKMKGYLERALKAHQKKMSSWFYNNPSNTVPSQGGAAGMAALALYFDSPEAAKAVEATRGKLATYAARCFSPDGGYIEGTLYWSFGGSFYLAFAHADRNTTGNDRLLKARHLDKQHRFAETMLGGDGQFMAFNDSQPWLSAWPVLVDLGRRYENELMLWLADRMAAIEAGKIDAPDVHVGHNYPPLTWVMMSQSDPGPARKAERPFPGVPTLTHLERMQWGVMRSSGDYIPDLVVGVKGSQGTLSHHGQKDLGSFVLYAGGEMMLLDPGYYQGRASDHTLPLINGKGPGKSGSQIAEAWERGTWRVMVIDSSLGYRRLAERVRRTLVMHDDRAVVVLDDVVAGDGAIKEDNAMGRWNPPPIDADPKAVDATAQYQTAHKPRVDAETGRVTIGGNNGSLSLWTFGPRLEFSVTARDFGKSWQFKKLARRGKYAWHTLAGRYTLDPDNPLITVLIPGPKEDQPKPPTVERDGRSILVTLPDGAELAFRKVDDGRWNLTRPRERDEAAR